MANWGLPGISSPLPADVRMFLDRVRDFINSVNTTSAVDQLVSAGLATPGPNGTTSLVVPPAVVDLTPPPALTGLAASGALTSVMLEWNDPLYANLAYVEVYRSATNNVAQAVQIGQTQGVMYTDTVTPGSTYFYWVRAVSIYGVVGPWQAVSGVNGTTSSDPAAIIDLLTAQGVYTDTPFYYQATPTVVNGMAVPAGTYVRAAYIADGTISNAKIGNLAVDNAKIASVSVDKLTAGSLAVGQYVKSSNYIAGTSGWLINADGSAELNNVAVRGNVRATSFSAITLQQGEHIKYGQTGFNNGTGFFLGDNGAGVPVFSLGSPTSGLTWNGATLAVKGDITGSSGTFTGSVTAGSFTGYAWPTNGGTGVYIGSLGLLAGNPNAGDGKYFQIYTPGNGTNAQIMTNIPAFLGDASVTTLKIAGNAVTAITTASSSTVVNLIGGGTRNFIFSSPTVYFSGSGSVLVQISTALITSLGEITYDISRDGVIVKPAEKVGYSPSGPQGSSAVVFCVDTPPAGYHTYTLHATSTGNAACRVEGYTCTLQECKK